MSLVLWNELCPEFYQKLNVGTVMHLQNYTLKQSYSNRSRPQMDHHRMKNFNSVGMYRPNISCMILSFIHRQPPPNLKKKNQLPFPHICHH